MIDLAEAVGRIALGGARLLLLSCGIVEIGAGAERLALRRKHRRADFDITIEFLQRVRDLVDQRDVEEVKRRPLDVDAADVPVFLDDDIRKLAHGRFPRELSWRRRSRLLLAQAEPARDDAAQLFLGAALN